MVPSRAAASQQASSAMPVKVSNASFLPASFGNTLACFTAAVPQSKSVNRSSAASDSGPRNVKSKGKGKAKQQASVDRDDEVRFIEFDNSPASRRVLITESYTVFAGMQTLASGSNGIGDDRSHDQRGTLLVQDSHIPSPQQVAYYARFAQLYRDVLSRYLMQLADEQEIDTDELTLVRDMRDAFHLAQILYVPYDGRGDGIVAEELLEYLNTTSPWPSHDRRNHLTSLAAPYEDNDFWGFIYSCILRGHLSLASAILETLLGHPSAVLKRITQSCLHLLASLPRSHSPAYKHESAFFTAVRQWRSRVSAQVARLDVEMDEFQEEIESQERESASHDEDTDESAEACADERFTWQAGFNCMLMLLAGDNSSIIDASEDGWKSALTAWSLLVRPGLKRDDIPETTQAITQRLPPDQTLFREAMSLAMLSGDAPRILRLAADTDAWLAAHLSDMLEKLGLLNDADAIDNVSIRDHFVLAYTDLLASDTGLWRCTVDYLASLQNAAIGRGHMQQILLAIGSTARNDIDCDTLSAADANKDQPASEQNPMQEIRKEAGKRTTIEDVLGVCATYGLEDVTRKLCLITSENLSSQGKYGMAVAYAARAGDRRRLNKIADSILDEYVQDGVKALSTIDSIPSSLLQPNDSIQPMQLSGLADDGRHVNAETAYALASSTRLRFLARFRDFHAFYASGDRESAGRLMALLLSSNEAPKRFWPVMLLDAIPLLNDTSIVLDEVDTLELLRCLAEIVAPVIRTGKDVFGYLQYLMTVTASTETEKREDAALHAALRQLDVVRYALTSNLARCYLR